MVQPAGVCTGDRGRDVLRRVAQVDGVDLGRAVCREETGAQREDATAVGSGAFWEDADDAFWVRGDQGGEGDEFGFVLGDDRGGCEGEQDRAKEGDALYFAAVGIGARKDGLENAGEVEGVEG